MTKNHIVYTKISLRKFLTIFFFSTLFFIGGATPALAISASLTVNGATNVTVYVGNQLSYVWSSADGTSWSGTYNVSPGTCPHGAGSGPWAWNNGNTSGGSQTDVATLNQIGCTYTMTYTVGGSGGPAVASIIVNIIPHTPSCGWFQPINNDSGNPPYTTPMGGNITYSVDNAYAWLALYPDGASLCRKTWDGGNLGTWFAPTGTWFERIGPLFSSCSDPGICSPPPNGRFIRQFQCSYPSGEVQLTNVCMACPPGHVPSGSSCIVPSGPVAPTVSIFWAPSNVTYGSMGTIYWNTTNATRCTHSDPTLGISFDDIYRPGINDGWFFNTTGWPYGNRTVNGETWTMSCWNGTTGPVTAVATLMVTPQAPPFISPGCPASDTNAKFSWTPVAGADFYAVRVDDYANGWGGYTPFSGDFLNDDLVVTNYEFPMIAGNSYRAWVHSRNAAGWSDPGSTDISGLVPTTYTSAGTSPQERRVAPRGVYKINVPSVGSACVGNSGTLTYFVPLKTAPEFNSFWNRVETFPPSLGIVNPLTGLYRIP